MNAIVCDKCGKVSLLEDGVPCLRPSGVYRLISDKDNSVIDLCECCANELVDAVRRTKEADGNG